MLCSGLIVSKYISMTALIHCATSHLKLFLFCHLTMTIIVDQPWKLACVLDL